MPPRNGEVHGGAPDVASLQGKRILVVDDTIQAADSLAKLLNRVGAHADALYSGEEALSHDLVPYQVLLIDAGMPRMDGYEVVAKLSARGFTTPIIALTGHSLPEDKVRATEAGFTAHLTKPVGLKELTEAILRVI